LLVIIVFAVTRRLRRIAPSTSAAWSSRSVDSRGERPGADVLIPGVQQMVRIDLRTVVLERAEPGRISHEQRLGQGERRWCTFAWSIAARRHQVEKFLEATSQLAQTTLRSVLGKHGLDEMLAERDRLNVDISGAGFADRRLGHQSLERGNQAGGPDESMIRAIARQAEAERERRAKVIHAKGSCKPRRNCSKRRRCWRSSRRQSSLRLPADPHADRRRTVVDDRVPAAHGFALGWSRGAQRSAGAVPGDR